jgi:hypothetical protein
MKIPSASISDIATMKARFPTRVAVEFHLLNCLIYLIFCHCTPVIRFDSVLVYFLCVYKSLGIAIAILQSERDKLFLMKLLLNRMMCHVLLAGDELTDT